MNMLDKNGNLYNYNAIVDTFNSMTASNKSQSSINSTVSSALKSLQNGGQYIDAVDPLEKRRY